MKLKELIGSGDKIVLFALPFAAVALLVKLLRPSVFAVRGPRALLKVISAITLVVGVMTWMWSVALILTRATKGELITTGPFAVMKHPLYTSVALLVLPSSGLLAGSWVGVPIGVAMYAGSRRYSPREEEALSETFGDRWDEYCDQVKAPWL
jgi:protein-S-isoprenylcysteine O-methyltransferase Ste14